jgi:chemotaxis protein MotB
MSKFHTKNEEAAEDWLLSYADMITLLMAFFIMLAAISKVDANLYEQVQSGMAKDIGNRTVGKPLSDLKGQLMAAVVENKADDGIDVGKDDQGVVLNLASGAMFAQGSAEIRKEMMPVLKDIVKILDDPRFEAYLIEVQGHTDDNPVNTAQYPTNWDLSAARSLATVKAFIQLGVKPVRLKAVAFADIKPMVPNRGPDGTPYPANQAINRRVSVHVFPR